jgi:hypothetical protein
VVVAAEDFLNITVIITGPLELLGKVMQEVMEL